jgi:hypothetical protein
MCTYSEIKVADGRGQVWTSHKELKKIKNVLGNVGIA